MKRAILLILIACPASAQTIPPNTSTTFSGPFSSNSLTISDKPWNYNVNADALTAPTVMVIAKSKACSLVVIDEDADKITLGCRKELRK